ncbi:hypothetical protein DF3PA_180018 [Candidatus Defluviicoccus seviourii]|uniref:Uncharacterized protein n=2 Tax=root TaxID=1 RepID=A0A564WDE0_9PROT|nr:hypothetical protein DF3PB_1040003 [uncultured Defluviicoccus sp.]VUX45988.1 hypothetical protein DF3PA_180018 [Candidatus Defluviicoccus seviourii]
MCRILGYALLDECVVREQSLRPMTALCPQRGCAYITQTGLFWVEKLYRQARTRVSRGTILVPGRHSPAWCSRARFAGHTAGKEAEQTIEGDAKAGATAASSNEIEATACDQFEHLSATRQRMQMTRN